MEGDRGCAGRTSGLKVELGLKIVGGNVSPTVEDPKHLNRIRLDPIKQQVIFHEQVAQSSAQVFPRYTRVRKRHELLRSQFYPVKNSICRSRAFNCDLQPDLDQVFFGAGRAMNDLPAHSAA